MFAYFNLWVIDFHYKIDFVLCWLSFKLFNSECEYIATVVTDCCHYEFKMPNQVIISARRQQKYFYSQTASLLSSP